MFLWKKLIWKLNVINADINVEDIAKLEHILQDLDAIKQQVIIYQSQILVVTQNIINIWNNSRENWILKKDENDTWQIETLSQYRDWT